MNKIYAFSISDSVFSGLMLICRLNLSLCVYRSAFFSTIIYKSLKGIYMFKTLKQQEAKAV